MHVAHHRQCLVLRNNAYDFPTASSLAANVCSIAKYIAKKSPCMNFSIFIEIPQIYTYTNSKLSDACMRENMLQWEQFHSLPFEISTQLNHNKFISIDLLMRLEYLENVDVKCP